MIGKQARRVRWAGYAGLLVLVPMGHAEPAQVQEVVRPLEGDPIAGLLLAGRAGKAQAGAIQKGLQRVELEDLYGALCRGRFQVRVGEGGRSSYGFEATEVEWLKQAVLQRPWRHLQSHFEARLEDGPETGERVVALGLIGDGLIGPELDDLARWAVPSEGKRRVDARVRAAFEEALGDVLVRRPNMLGRVPSLVGNAHGSLLPAALSALTAQQSTEALQAQAQILGSDEQINALVLIEMGQLAKTLPKPIEPRACERVRQYLGADSSAVLTEAIIAVRHMDDSESVPELIEVLQDGMPVHQAAAHQALTSITGQIHSARARTWRDWHRGSLDWWVGPAQESLRAIRGGSAASRSRILMELSKQRLHRHAISENLVSLLGSSDETLVTLTCAVLGHLGSRRATSGLIHALMRPSVDVKRAAYLALCSITGEDHGEDVDAWKEAGW